MDDTTVDETVDESTPQEADGASAPVGMSGKRKRKPTKQRHGMIWAALPRGCGWIRTVATKFRRSLEEAVVEARGGLTLLDAATIDSATRWQTSALVCGRWLRLHEATMSHLERLQFIREIARFGSERDKCLRQLRLAPQEVAEDSAARALTDALADPLAAAQEHYARLDARARVESIDALSTNGGNHADETTDDPAPQ
jgi:hypothetical protein